MSTTATGVQVCIACHQAIKFISYWVYGYFKIDWNTHTDGPYCEDCYLELKRSTEMAKKVPTLGSPSNGRSSEPWKPNSQL